MENELKQITALLEKINTHNANNIISPAELDEQYQRIKNVEWLNKTAIENLDLLKKSYSSSIDEIMGQICYMNVELGTYFGHMGNTKDTIEKFIANNKTSD